MYAVELTRQAEKGLDRLPTSDYLRVRSAIDRLAQDPRPSGCIKMTSQNYWRVRAGDYRVIYAVDDDQQVVTVVQVGHRREVYR